MAINKVIYGGSTLIDLTGDDVTASDVLAGKIFHLANGDQSVGTKEFLTASVVDENLIVTNGDSATLGTKSITSNGTYDANDDNLDGYSEVTVNVNPSLQSKTVTPTTSSQTVTADSGYDGLDTVTVNATKHVTGTFTTGSTTGTTETVTIPYTGSGYPIAIMIYIEGGAYNSNGDTNWYNSVQRYAVGQWTMHKSVQTSSPTYGTSGSANYGVTSWIYKNNTSSATAYSRSSAMNTNAFSSSNATGAGATCVRVKSATQLSIYVASTSYGLLANTTYRYHIIYS